MSTTPERRDRPAEPDAKRQRPAASPPTPKPPEPPRPPSPPRAPRSKKRRPDEKPLKKAKRTTTAAADAMSRLVKKTTTAATITTTTQEFAPPAPAAPQPPQPPQPRPPPKRRKRDPKDESEKRKKRKKLAESAVHSGESAGATAAAAQAAATAAAQAPAAIAAAQTLAAAPLAQPDRRTGKPFEDHTKRVLRLVAAGDAAAAVRGDDLALALAGKEVFAWSEVPADVLVRMGWEPAGEAERRRIYEGPREERGFVGEYGLDWVAIGEINGIWHIVVGQDKDHAILSAGVLGRFFLMADDAHALNAENGIPDTVPSAVLCYPATSRISRRDGAKLRSKRTRWGLLCAAFPGFAPTPGRDPAEQEQQQEQQQAQEHELAPLDPHAVAPLAPPVRGAVGAAGAAGVAGAAGAPGVAGVAGVGGVGSVVAASTEDGGGATTKLPGGVRLRPFQQKAVRTIVAKGGIYLVWAPPGAGKTYVVVKVVNLLVTPAHDTRNARSNLFITFIICPYKDHVIQIFEKLKGVLRKQLGSNWRSLVQKVFDDEVPTQQQLLDGLQSGVRVFLSTDVSAKLMLKTAKAAKARGNRILVVKDEAHYNSYHDSASTKLLALVDPDAGDVAVACTATPDNDVLALPGIQFALRMPLDEAIRLGYCRPYRVVLPQITGVADGLPVEARDLASAHRLGAAALFTVGGMLRDGKRRCIAYTRDGVEAAAAADLLRQACEFHGVDYAFDVIVNETGVADRRAKYRKFRFSPVSSPAQLNGEAGHRPILRFLVSVRILDMCVDMPEADCISLLSPSAGYVDVKSAHRAIQQLGRVTRGEFGGVASMYVFTSLDNPWLTKFFAVLKEFDPGCVSRVCVRSTNPVTQYSEAAARQAASSLAKVVARYNVDGSADSYKDAQTTELARLVLLVYAGKDDPKTGVKARMPSQTREGRSSRFRLEKDYLGIGNLWHSMKGQGLRKAELAAKLWDGFPLDAFISSHVRVRAVKEYTAEEQMVELARLVLLVDAEKEDPKTGAKARMPRRPCDGGEDYLGLGNLWHNMKFLGIRKGELAAKLPGFDLDAFIASQTKKRK